MKITLPDGSKKNIDIKKMGAMEGWEIQRRFIEFAMSKDPAFRMQYTFEVLAFAAVKLDSGQEIPLSTGALIDNHLQCWENIRDVFNEVLRHNGIDPDNHADKPHYWALAGAEMATAFLGATIELMGPLMKGEKSE